MAGFIKCPTCKAEIPLTEVIDHEIHEQLESRLAAELTERERTHATALAEREQELREAFEREIENVLRERFPLDAIEPIKAGTRGADVLQTVNHRGGVSGKILWESKRARNFSSGWIAKLKQDQADRGAEFAVLVCTT